MLRFGNSRHWKFECLAVENASKSTDKISTNFVIERDSSHFFE